VGHPCAQSRPAKEQVRRFLFALFQEVYMAVRKLFWCPRSERLFLALSQSPSGSILATRSGRIIPRVSTASARREVRGGIIFLRWRSAGPGGVENMTTAFRSSTRCELGQLALVRLMEVF
jgi:hypothetical protein